MLTPKIEVITERKFIGARQQQPMDIMAVFILWKEFVHRKYEIKQAVAQEMYAIHTYDGVFYRDARFTDVQVESWAALEVTDFLDIPQGMYTFTLKSGLYATFEHHGTLNEFPNTLADIYENWFPDSEYCLDDRPHLSIRGLDYNPYRNSTEILWVPIRKKED